MAVNLFAASFVDVANATHICVLPGANIVLDWCYINCGFIGGVPVHQAQLFLETSAGQLLWMQQFVAPIASQSIFAPSLISFNQLFLPRGVGINVRSALFGTTNCQYQVSINGQGVN